MDRVIPIKTVKHGSLHLRAGLCYALPDLLADELLLLGLVYREGDDPPFAQEDLDKMDAAAAIVRAINVEHAALVASRERATEERKAKAIEDMKKAREQAAALLAARKARK